VTFASLHSAVAKPDAAYFSAALNRRPRSKRHQAWQPFKWVTLGQVAWLLPRSAIAPISLRYRSARLNVVGVEPRGWKCTFKNLECETNNNHFRLSGPNKFVWREPNMIAGRSWEGWRSGSGMPAGTHSFGRSLGMRARAQTARAGLTLSERALNMSNTKPQPAACLFHKIVLIPFCFSIGLAK